MIFRVRDIQKNEIVKDISDFYINSKGELFIKLNAIMIYTSDNHYIVEFGFILNGMKIYENDIVEYRHLYNPVGLCEGILNFVNGCFTVNGNHFTSIDEVKVIGHAKINEVKDEPE